MGQYVIPVRVGRTHEGRDVTKAVGTFSSLVEAQQWRLKMLSEGTVLEADEPLDLLSLKGLAAFKAAAKAEAIVPNLNTTDEPPRAMQNPLQQIFGLNEEDADRISGQARHSVQRALGREGTDEA